MKDVEGRTLRIDFDKKRERHSSQLAEGEEHQERDRRNSVDGDLVDE